MLKVFTDLLNSLVLVVLEVLLDVGEGKASAGDELVVVEPALVGVDVGEGRGFG